MMATDPNPTFISNKTTTDEDDKSDDPALPFGSDLAIRAADAKHET